MPDVRGSVSSTLPVDDVQLSHLNGEINPEPIILDDTEVLANDFLSPTRLEEIAGQSDLENLTMMEMVVNTTETTMGNFGTYLPNLQYLKLSNSIIPSVRDIGTSLSHLKVLWMSCCGLKDVDGIASMISLTELYLAYNNISDISPLSFLEDLQVLDLEGNQISDKEQFEYLSMMSELRTLSISGNPVCQTINKDALHHLEMNSFQSSIDTMTYREFIIKKLPQVKYIDDEKCENFDSGQAQSLSDRPSTASLAASSHSQEDIELITNAIKEGLISEEETAAICLGEEAEFTPSGYSFSNSKTRPASAGFKRPTSALTRPSTANPLGRSILSPSSRPQTAVSSGRSGSAGAVRSDSLLQKAANAQRPNSSGSGEVNLEDESSTLTFGEVICGNPIKALRARKVSPLPVLNMLKKSSTQRPATAAPFRMAPHTPQSHSEVENFESKDDVFADLRKWRAMHEERLKQRDSNIQILKLDNNTSSEEILLDSDGTDSEADEILDLDAIPTYHDDNNNISDSGEKSPNDLHRERTRLRDLPSQAVANKSVNRVHSPPPKNLSPNSVASSFSSRNSNTSPTSPLFSSAQLDTTTVPVLRGSPKPKTPTSPQQGDSAQRHVPAPPRVGAPRPRTAADFRIRRSLASSSDMYVPLASPMTHPQGKRRTTSKVNQ